MKKAKLFLGLMLVAAFSLTCCNNSDSNNTSTDVTSTETETTVNNEKNIKYKFYSLAQQTGFNGSYEEWLDSLNSNIVQLRISNTYVEWKNSDSNEWTELIKIKNLYMLIREGIDTREVEISTSATHIIWRYIGENSWTDLIEISLLYGNNDESAYDIAVKLGFGGTIEEWIESLKIKNNNILKIEKTKSEGLFDYYTIYYTDDSTYEFTIKNNLIDKTTGLILSEVEEKGYLVTGYSSSASKNIVIPSTYNDKKVYGINSQDLFNNLTIPNTIESIEHLEVKKLFFDGTEEEFFNIESDYINAYNVYVLNENGSINNNGKKYEYLCSINDNTIYEYNFNGTIEEFIESDLYNSKYSFEYLTLNWKTFDGNVVISEGTKKLPDISRILDIKSLTIPSSIDFIGKDIFKNIILKNVYYNGSLLDYSKIEFENEYSNPSYNKDKSNSISTHFYIKEANDYELVNDIVITDEFNFENTYWYYGINGNQVLIDKRDSYSDEIYDFAKNFNIVIFNDTFGSNENFFKSNPYYYFLDEEGIFEYLGNKYTNYHLMNSGGPIQNNQIIWNPLTLADVKDSYNVKGDLNTAIVYVKTYGITYNGAINSSSTTNPIDGITYQTGDLLPTWQAFADKLGITNITRGMNYGTADSDTYTSFLAMRDSNDNFIDRNGDKTDLFFNTTTNLNSLGDSGYAIDLTSYIDGGQMPALKKFLDENPAVRQEITHNGHIYYTPYMDGYQAVERGFVMDTEQVAKLLDYDLPLGTGNLAAGLNGAGKGLKSEPKAEAFIGSNGKNYDSTMKITIVNPRDKTKAVEVTVKQTDNILKQQNELLAKGTTGKELIEQFKEYAKAAYGDIINNYYDGKISNMFTSVGACYNADDLVALLRIFKANPDVLYGSADLYDEVVPVFPRGQVDIRVSNILNFGATLYGVQGMDSEYDHLYFGADGKLHDADTTQASYDLLDKLNALYSEGLIQANFWSGSKGTSGYDRFFAKTVDNNSTFGLLEYDYFGTQSLANDRNNGLGTKPADRKKSQSGYDFSYEAVRGVKAILSPLTYVSTESFNSTQALDDKTGKTIIRYYEANRTVKTTSWCIPSSSDNVDTALALMDFMFTKEGYEIQNFGPEGYWDYGTVFGEENTPIIKQNIIDHVAFTDLVFWNYCRGFLGTNLGIGHYEPISLDYQATNYYSRDGYDNVVTACNLGVQINSRAVGSISDYSWHASMPMSVFFTVDDTTALSYTGVSDFWSQKGKSRVDGTISGWVAIVAMGKDYTGKVLTNTKNGDYTYSSVKAEIATKNYTYLQQMGNVLGLVPDEAKKA